MSLLGVVDDLQDSTPSITIRKKRNRIQGIRPEREPDEHLERISTIAEQVVGGAGDLGGIDIKPEEDDATSLSNLWEIGIGAGCRDKETAHELLGENSGLSGVV